MENLHSSDREDCRDLRHDAKDLLLALVFEGRQVFGDVSREVNVSLGTSPGEHAAEPITQPGRACL